MNGQTGRLLIVAQAVSTGVRAGPYRIDVFTGHKKRLPKSAKYSAQSVLGSPTNFELPPGKYTVRLSNSKEGQFIERTSVQANEENILLISVGRVLARSYNDLLVQMAPLQKRFESFMLDLGQDRDLQAKFLANPDQILQNKKLLPEGNRLSRKNRLFIALLAKEDLRNIIRQGERGIKVPSQFRKRHSPQLRRILKKHVLAGRQPTLELLDSSIQRWYFFQEVLTSILTDPIVEILYHVTFSQKGVYQLFDATYEFVGIVDPTSAARSLAATDGPGIAAVITFSILNINAGVGTSSKAAIFVDAGIFTNSTIFTDSRIFTSTNVVCSLAPTNPREIGISDDYELFEDHTVAPKLSRAFQLDDFQVNELSNYAALADAITEGLNVMDYKKALAYAREQLVG